MQLEDKENGQELNVRSNDDQYLSSLMINQKVNRYGMDPIDWYFFLSCRHNESHILINDGVNPRFYGEINWMVNIETVLT